MTNLTQVKTRIIQPVLNALGPLWDSQAAANLLTYTFLAESGGGQNIVQLGGGPALGPFQMEPATHDDCWANFLAYQQELAAIGKQLACGGNVGSSQMVGNWSYAAFMARVRYIRAPQALPAPNDAAGIANYHKTVYNTSLGATVVDAEHIAWAQQAIAA